MGGGCVGCRGGGLRLPPEWVWRSCRTGGVFVFVAVGLRGSGSDGGAISVIRHCSSPLHITVAPSSPSAHDYGVAIPSIRHYDNVFPTQYIAFQLTFPVFFVRCTCVRHRAQSCHVVLTCPGDVARALCFVRISTWLCRSLHTVCGCSGSRLLQRGASHLHTLIKPKRTKGRTM